MDANQLIDAITPEAYERLVFAVETGKWPEVQHFLRSSEITVCKL